MGKLGAGPVQGLLGELAFCYVLESADEHGVTRALPHNASQAVQVLYGAPRGHNPESKVNIRSRHSARDHSVERRQVLGVDRVPTHLEVDLGRGIELKDTERLLGPVVFVQQQIRDEAACFTQPLSFGETKISLFDLCLCPLSVVDVERGRIPSIDSSLLIE